jgi:hypothetical protein
MKVMNPTEVMRNGSEVVAVTFQTVEGKMTISKRQRPNFWSASIYQKNDYLARPRVFAFSEEQANESLLENLENRTRRPSTILRKGVLAMMTKLELPILKSELKWSNNAGCRMCPCSPGFILQVDGYSKHNERSINLRFELPTGEVVDFPRWDVDVTLVGVPAVDERRPARQVVGI